MPLTSTYPISAYTPAIKLANLIRVALSLPAPTEANLLSFAGICSELIRDIIPTAERIRQATKEYNTMSELAFTDDLNPDMLLLSLYATMIGYLKSSEPITEEQMVNFMEHLARSYSLLFEVRLRRVQADIMAEAEEFDQLLFANLPSQSQEFH